MATYYKYAERSADSQINWAEVGKNMTDMLQNEVRIREEKKAAIDEATRRFGIELANAPQGQHKGINQWALEYGDNASQYMLMQERLLKSGAMKLKDYIVSRQNLIDGTKQAFDLVKEFNTSYADKMERYKKDDSQDFEIWLNGQAEKFGDFTKSQLYINPTDGTVSVAMREMQTVDGKQVFTMNKNPNEFTTINALRNNIAGRYDRFNTNAVTDAFANSLGKEETSSIVFGTLSRGGVITSVEDITKRVDIDPETKSIMFKFIDAENQMISASLANPFNRLSVLTNSKKFAPNGKQYTFTYDAADAKANPEKVLIKVDPATGRPMPEFNEEQIKVSNEFMRNEVRAKYDMIQKQNATGQAQLQESRQPSEWEAVRGDKQKIQQLASGAWNQLYTGKTAAEKKAAADILLGTPMAKEEGLVAIDMSQPGKILLRYKDSKKNRPISYLDASGNPVNFGDFSAAGVELHGVVDRKKAMMAGGGGSGFGRLSKEEYKGIVSSRQGETATAIVNYVMPSTAVSLESSIASKNLQSSLPAGFKVEDKGGRFGNTILVTAPNGKTFTYTSKAFGERGEKIKEDVEKFVNDNSGGMAVEPEL
ncbi:MAG: hypothetical protein ACK5DE_03830 [Bacteroidota bacterium]|jgi:hypothetical protein